MDKLIDLMRESGLYLVAGAAALVLLLVVIGWASRRPKRRGSSGSSGPRLAILDQIALDDRRKLVLVRRDNVEHLLMIGGATELLVECGAPRTVPADIRAPVPPAEPRTSDHRPPVSEARAQVPAAGPAPLAAAPARAPEPVPPPPPAGGRIEPGRIEPVVNVPRPPARPAEEPAQPPAAVAQSEAEPAAPRPAAQPSPFQGLVAAPSADERPPASGDR